MLPHQNSVIVEERKIVEYLLAYEDDSGKARFFTSVGFTTARWRYFAAILIQHAAENDVAYTEQTGYGVKYIIEGTISTPNGRNPQIRSVWIVEHDKQVPRLVTAYPLKR